MCCLNYWYAGLKINEPLMQLLFESHARNNYCNKIGGVIALKF